MIITMESHLDHAGLTLGHLKHLLKEFGGVELNAEKEPARIVTISFPAELGQLPSGLWGPLAGDEPVPETEVVYARRPGREYDSRLVARGERMVSTATVVIVHDANRTVLATVYGGPQAPQEPGDPRCRNIGESREFCAVHALARPS